MAAQLEELDAALLRFSTGANRRVGDAVGFDAARWFDAVRVALQVPIETPEYPGRKFIVQCADIAGAVATLARADGRMLGALAWRGTVVDKAMARWRPEQYVEISARQVARGNPWAACPAASTWDSRAPMPTSPSPAYFVAGARSAAARLCNQPAMMGVAADRSAGSRPQPVGIAGEATADMPADDERWSVPPSLAVMLQPLATLQRPTGSLYRLYTDGAADGGRHADELSLWSESHRHRRHAGRRRLFDRPHHRARGAGVGAADGGLLHRAPGRLPGAGRARAAKTRRSAIGHRMLEHAVVRMAAIAVIDIASGRIEALAGALSPCTRQEYDGPGRAANCDKRLPYPIRYRPDALLNPAVYHDAMPASVIKPIMAAAFLSDRDVGARWLAAEQAAMHRPGAPALDSLRGQLMRSNSARFLDRMFCADQAFQHCRRPWDVQAMALAFGWNDGCDDARDDCGKRDLLFGRAVDASDDSGAVAPLATLVPYGRLLAEPLGNKLGRAVSAASRDAARSPPRCARAPRAPTAQRRSSDDWEQVPRRAASSTSSPKAGDRDMRAPARSASPA